MARDPEQAWILGELVRYLRHPNSGASAFDDMGSEWVAVRDGARDKALRKNDPGVRDVAQRWDQLLRYAALRLEADIGQTVTQQVPAAQREGSKRLQHLVDTLTSDGVVDGSLRIPNTVGDLELHVDLRARRVSASVTVSAPEDRGGKARCTWLAGQLSSDVDDRSVIEAYGENARTPTTATLAQVREDKDCLLGGDTREPARFRITLTKEMGVAPKTGRKAAGFIDSVLALINEFYGTVVQNLPPWTPKAPQITRAETAAEPDSVPGRIEMKRSPAVEDRDQDTEGPKGATIDDGTPSDGSLLLNDPWLRVTRG